MGTSSRRDRGFTLVELMVVVTVVGLLSAAAVFAYTKWVKKAREAEIQEVFGHFMLKQEQYYLENSEYRSTGADEGDRFPSPSASKPGALGSGHPDWNELRFDLNKTALYCSYVIIAGTADDDTGIGALGTPFMINPDPPTQDWWYGIAYCPFNGKSYGFRWDRDRAFEL